MYYFRRSKTLFMNDMFIAYIAGVFISLTILYFLIRAAFSVDKQLRNQQAQIALLVKMASRLGVTDEEIKNIEKNFGR